MRVPQTEKIFLRMQGMSELKHASFKMHDLFNFCYFKERFSLNVACQITCMHVSWLFDGGLVAWTYNFFNFEKFCFFKSTSLSLQ